MPSSPADVGFPRRRRRYAGRRRRAQNAHQERQIIMRRSDNEPRARGDCVRARPTAARDADGASRRRGSYTRADRRHRSRCQDVALMAAPRTTACPASPPSRRTAPPASAASFPTRRALADCSWKRSAICSTCRSAISRPASGSRTAPFSARPKRGRCLPAFAKNAGVEARAPGNDDSETVNCTRGGRGATPPTRHLIPVARSAGRR